jgi:hypothetical protein
MQSSNKPVVLPITGESRAILYDPQRIQFATLKTNEQAARSVWPKQGTQGQSCRKTKSSNGKSCRRYLTAQKFLSLLAITQRTSTS